MLALPSAALRVSPLTTRRSAIAAGAASLVPAALVPMRAAHADALEDIAARSNAAAEEARAKRAKQAEGQALKDAAGGGFNIILSAGILTLLGGAGAFFFGIKKDADATKSFNLDNNRLLTDEEKRRYAKLSPQERKALGIID